MTLAPVRGAPAGASVPAFPIEEPPAKPAQQSAMPASGDQRPTMLRRQRYTPVDIGGNGITLTFRVIPKMPAISPASLTVRVVADTLALGFLRMSAPNARAFLTPTECTFSDCRHG
jgi:hypothetical protein